jgi:competence protein ComEC
VKNSFRFLRWAGFVFCAVALWLHHRASLVPLKVSGPVLSALVLAFVLQLLFKRMRLGCQLYLAWPRIVAAFELSLSFSIIACTAAVFYTLNADQRLATRVPAALDGQVIWVTGRITSAPNFSGASTRFRFQTEAHAQLPTPSSLMLSWYQPAFELMPGQSWQLAVRLRQANGPINFGGFDSQESALRQGIDGYGTVITKRAGQSLEPKQLPLQTNGFAHIADKIELVRMRISQGLDQIDPQVNASTINLFKALSIGEQNALNAEQWQLFNRTGTSHLMSISGMHVTMLAALGGWFAIRLWAIYAKFLAPVGTAVRANWRVCAMVFVATGYCALAGWGVPAQRTLAMLVLLLLLTRLAQQTQFLFYLQMAALALLLIDPLSVGAPGFWLSFLAVACLALSTRVGQGTATAKSKFVAGVRTQVACTLGLAPVLAYFYASFSFSSLFANALAIPVVGFVVTPLAVLSGLLVWLGQWSSQLQWLAGWPAQLAQWCIDPLYQYLNWLDQFKELNQPMVINNGWAAFACSVMIAVVLSPLRLSLRGFCALIAVVILAWPKANLAPSQWQLHVIDVGNGAAMLLRSNDHAVLVDTGPGQANAGDSGANIIWPYLYRLGIKTLDAVILTHDDNEHIGGTRSILKLFHVKRLVKPKHLHRAAIHDLDSQTEIIDCQRGGQLNLGVFRFEFLHPSHVIETFKRNNANAHSCVLQLQAPVHRVLFAADIQAEQEALLTQLYGQALKADVLIVPNGGSHASSSEPFVNAVSPTHAVIQVGHRNRFGYPREVVLNRYLAANAQVHRTDKTGALRMDFSADGIFIDSARTSQWAYWRQSEP